MTYTHKMNTPNFEDKVEFSYYYQPKKWKPSLRVIVDANTILKKTLKETGLEKDNYSEIIQALPDKDYNSGDSIDVIKLHFYKTEQKQLLEQLGFKPFEERKAAAKELFNKYFKVTGEYMKTITLR